MKITALETKKLPIKLKGEFKIAFTSIGMAENVLLRIDTDEGISGYGEAAPFVPVTGETAEGVLAALELLRPGLLGRDPFGLDTIHALMDTALHGNSSAKCAVDLALYDIIGKAAGKPVYRILGGENGLVQNGATIGIAEPQEMAREARYYVEERGYRIIKIKVGLEPQRDLEALRLIRQAVGDQVRLRVDANQGYTITGAIEALEGFAALGVDVAEQCLPDWNLEGTAQLRSKIRGIDLMLDESLHSPHDAARACRIGAADRFNIKLMKCGGLYPGSQISAIAASFGLRCMVGCMLETRIALTAGLSLVAARGNITDADCDSFLFFDEKQTGVTGGFTVEGDMFRLSEEGGLGVTVDF
ncbi:MAG: dipeptide epimerase [Spirochaetaceae bacterium]|jgi:L-alanine-DL-glutamate epimerase-like enolase superfamily enzyme|nr:dipeptide epimerase [Spirochaetaceae bacterium]